jgi:ankyrin repeat protein
MEQLLKAGAKGDVHESDILKEIAKERVVDKNCNLEIAELLLDYGIDPNLRCHDDDTSALMIAIYNDDQEYAALLLKYKANPYQTTKQADISLEFPFLWNKTSKARNIFDIIGTKKQWFLDLIHH